MGVGSGRDETSGIADGMGEKTRYSMVSVFPTTVRMGWRKHHVDELFRAEGAIR